MLNYELKEWKKLDKKQQFDIVYEISKKFFDRLELVKVDNQSIEVTLFVEKNLFYDLLVEYETFLRQSLGNFPIIVLLKEKKDENKKRK